MIQTRGQFNLLSLNAQSLNAKFDDLLLLIETFTNTYIFTLYASRKPGWVTILIYPCYKLMDINASRVGHDQNIVIMGVSWYT